MLSRTSRRLLPHYCCIHPRSDYRSFQLHEGHIINGKGFICHSCLARQKRRRTIAANDHKNTPIEKQVFRYLAQRKCRFIPHYMIGKFQFDAAIPHLRILIEADGRTYHKAEKPTEDAVPKPLRKGTKAWTAHHNGWKLVRVRNGPSFESRLRREIESMMAGS